MDDFKITIARLRDMITEQLDDPAQRRHADLGAQVREQVVRLLRRKDLRIAAEFALHDLRNVFSGFETFDPNNRRQTMEQALRLIENLDVLIAGDQALNPDRGELPPPPPVIADLLGDKERKVRQETRSQLDRLRVERNKHRSIRRPLPQPQRPPKKPAPAESGKETLDRDHLAFNAGSGPLGDAPKPREGGEGYRGPRPPREGGERSPVQGQSPHHKNEGAGPAGTGRRKHWRGRRRPHRPKQPQ